MELANCRRCKKVFTKLREPFCPDCFAIEEGLFKTVKDFLFTNPNCNVHQVAKATGVSPSRILAYIKGGRIG
jgi:hypothetical protein